MPFGGSQFGSPPFGSNPGPYAVPTAPIGDGRQFGSSFINDVSIVDRSVSPPFVWLYLALAATLLSLVGGALSFSGGSIYIAAWAVGGPIAIGLLAVYSARETIAQTHLFYSFPLWLISVYRAAFVLSLLAVLLNAWRIANWAGHL